jgi:hypothetical protein
MNNVERIYQRKLAAAKSIASQLSVMYPNAQVKFGSEEQRKGPTVMRVRLNYESETFVLVAYVTVYGDYTYRVGVVADEYDSQTDKLNEVLNVGSDDVHGIPATLRFIEAVVGDSLNDQVASV